jgi:hypothetical protein
MSDPSEPSSDRSIARLEAALARLGAEHEPPAGWEARVLAAVGTTERRRRWWMYAAPGVALAAAAAIALFVMIGSPPPAFALRVDVRPSAVYRGEQPSVGDVLRIAVSGGTAPRAIWVYHEEVQLVLRCPGTPSCRVTEDSIAVELTLTSAGNYTVVALTGAGALQVPSGRYDTDTAAAREAGAQIRQEQKVVQ